MTFIAGKRRRLLFAGDDDEVFMTRSLKVTPKTKQNSIVRSGKSEAAITNNKRLCSRYCTRQKASSGLSATAELLGRTIDCERSSSVSCIWLLANYCEPTVAAMLIELCIGIMLIMSDLPNYVDVSSLCGIA